MSEIAAPPSYSATTVIDLIKTLGTCRIESKQLIRVVYLDSFDGLLQQAGLELAAEKQANDHRLTLQSASTTRQLTYVGEALPRFAWELPPSPLRNTIAKTIDVRALLPLLTLRCERTVIALLNKDEKTVARVNYQSVKIHGGSDHGKALSSRIVVEPLRGYSKASKRLSQLLASHGQLQTAPLSTYREALSATNTDPPANSSKLRLALNPHTRSDTALREILKSVFDTMKRNEPGIRAAIDSEYLHDYRVSVRRTRSALSQVKQVLPQPITQRFSKEFAWLGAATTPLRDLDVYYLTYPEYEAELPPELRGDLAPLKAFLVSHQASAHRQLVRCLDSKRHQRLCDDWQKFLGSPVPNRTKIANAKRPIGEVASERIWKVYKKTMKQGAAIDDGTPAQALHDLRKTCKKLRYLMEFFRSLYNAKPIGKAIKKLKELQDVLGTFQDLEVQQETLRHCAERMVEEGATPAATLIAMGVLVERLHVLQGETRGHFAERFHRFASTENQRLFKKLFRSTHSASGKHPS